MSVWEILSATGKLKLKLSSYPLNHVRLIADKSPNPGGAPALFSFRLCLFGH